MKKLLSLTASVLLLWIFANHINVQAVLGDVPKKISYQGSLTDSTGAPVSDGGYDMRFDLYEASSGGSSLWTETHAGVSIQKGTFSVLLGPISIAFDKPLFMEVTVTGGPGITSSITFLRSELTTVPYAFRSDTSNSLSLPFTGSKSTSSDDFSITNTGSGRAGYFKINNVSNASVALQVETNGGNAALDVGNKGNPGFTAGYFHIDNASNPHAAVEAYTKGSGSAVLAKNGGTGTAGLFQNDAFNNSLPALEAYTYGTGPATAISGLGGSSKGLSIGAAPGQYLIQAGNSLFVKSGSDGNGGIVGIGTVFPQGALDVSSTTGGFIVPRMTTTQRNALTAVNGMIIYNASTNQFNFYENGSWVTK